MVFFRILRKFRKCERGREQKVFFTFGLRGVNLHFSASPILRKKIRIKSRYNTCSRAVLYVHTRCIPLPQKCIWLLFLFLGGYRALDACWIEEKRVEMDFFALWVWRCRQNWAPPILASLGQQCGWQWQRERERGMEKGPPLPSLQKQKFLGRQKHRRTDLSDEI